MDAKQSMTVSAGDDLGAFEHIFDAVGRVDDIVFGQVIPHIAILVAPIFTFKQSMNSNLNET